MQTTFHELTSETKELLFEINTMYIECGKNDSKMSRAFLDKYHDEIKTNSDPIKDKLATLEEFGYIKNQSHGGPIAPTHKGLNYKEARFIYWRHKVFIPISVSVITSLAVNIIIKIISRKLGW